MPKPCQTTIAADFRQMLTEFEKGNIADAWQKLDADRELAAEPENHICTPNQSGKYLKLTHYDRSLGESGSHF